MAGAKGCENFRMRQLHAAVVARRLVGIERETLPVLELRGAFGERAEPKDPDERDMPLSLRNEKTALTVKPDHANVAAYFNIDNGGGKLRGIYAQENAALRPVFAAWLEPFADLGADTVTLRRTGGTAHQSFDGVGLPMTKAKVKKEA